MLLNSQLVPQGALAPGYSFVLSQTQHCVGNMWSNIEEQLLFYSELTPEERLQVDQQVQQHPELIAQLEAAKAFAALIKDAQLLQANPPGDEALAYYIATHRVSRQPLSAPLQEAFGRIEAALANDATLRARYVELVRRMATLEAASDPISQFEQLSGHQLPQTSYEAELLNGEENTPSPVPFEIMKPPDRRPVLRRLWVRGRLAMAAVTLGVVLYGSLGLVSHFSQSDLDRLVDLDEEMFALDDTRVRGDAGADDQDTADALYKRALPLLREARITILGLFPHYNAASLLEAADLLERVVQKEEEYSILRAEANYFLAQIRLAQKNTEGAKVALQAVIDGPGLWVREAQTQLDEINALTK